MTENGLPAMNASTKNLLVAERAEDPSQKGEY